MHLPLVLASFAVPVSYRPNLPLGCLRDCRNRECRCPVNTPDTNRAGIWQRDAVPLIRQSFRPGTCFGVVALKSVTPVPASASERSSAISRYGTLLDSHDPGIPAQLESISDPDGRRDDALAQHPRGNFASCGTHVFNKAAQFGELRFDAWFQNKCAAASTDLQQASLNQILDCTANRDPADPESPKELIFRG